ncbi:MAG: acylphosphatase [candidate division Zixibacteria bacterium]|nr:acylphosphatase [Candidatus Tariuqbacter arcticus]
MIGADIFVDGIVQGVGFRWYTYNLANSFGLPGWVRNRMRGDVEVYVEGEREVVEEFIAELRKGPRFGRVDAVEVTWKKATGKYDMFKVAR